MPVPVVGQWYQCVDAVRDDYPQHVDNFFLVVKASDNGRHAKIRCYKADGSLHWGEKDPEQGWDMSLAPRLIQVDAPWFASPRVTVDEGL